MRKTVIEDPVQLFLEPLLGRLSSGAGCRVEPIFCAAPGGPACAVGAPGAAGQGRSHGGDGKDGRIVLGEEAPAVPDHWVLYPLEVGGDRVGALSMEFNHAEGPEPRQQDVVAQLLPTVALVARAVGLAVEADHARRDVARGRDAERRRVLGELYDGQGARGNVVVRLEEVATAR